MKMHKIVSLLMASVMVVGSFTACGKSSQTNSNTNESANKAESNAVTSDGSLDLEALGLDENLRFIEPRTITVEVYERNNDGGSKPEDNYYTQYIKDGMLRDHNINIVFKPVPRWTEVEEINNLLASGDAPDICVTYNYPTVLTYAQMGGIMDLDPYVNGYKDILPNLWELLTDTNINWNKIPDTGNIWAIESLLKHNVYVNTFIREDWLNKLGLPVPTTMEEFESTLYAFKDNAEKLLGKDASKIIPFSTSYDLSWRTSNILYSYIPNETTDKEYYINGFDDRKFTQEGVKESYRKINEWYNNGLIWKDFPLYGPGDKTEDNYIKSGYVGAFIHNWDYPYRDGDEGITANLKRLVGEDANYIAIDTFKNDAGLYKKYLPGPVDRKIFFPAPNKEPIASMLYLDWLSRLETRMFLQIGDEGVTHEKLEDGSIKVLSVTGDKIMNSPSNIDYTLTINGLDLGDKDLTILSMANNYPGTDERLIEKAYEITGNDARLGKNVNVGIVEAEEGQGPALKEKRDVMLNNAVVAKPELFDSVWDSGMKDYLGSGGQAIKDERAEKWQQFFGDATELPEKQ